MKKFFGELPRRGNDGASYIARKETGTLAVILLSCGSELQHALAATKELGDGTRGVSLPCFERFERQPESYRAQVLPNECRRRVAIEAGIPEIWSQYVGLDWKIVGLKRFGLSAPGSEAMKEIGIDPQNVIDAARSL
jgi:transketolase